MSPLKVIFNVLFNGTTPIYLYSLRFKGSGPSQCHSLYMLILLEKLGFSSLVIYTGAVLRLLWSGAILKNSITPN